MNYTLLASMTNDMTSFGTGRPFAKSCSLCSITFTPVSRNNWIALRTSCLNFLFKNGILCNYSNLNMNNMKATVSAAHNNAMGICLKTIISLCSTCFQEYMNPQQQHLPRNVLVHCLS